MATTIRGDMADGDLRSLTFGQIVSWNAVGTQTLFQCQPGQNAVICFVVARNPTGTQPTTFIVTCNPTGGNVTGSISTVGLTSGLANNLALVSATPVILNSQSLIVTPVGSTSGSLTFDVLGYTFSSGT